MREMKRGISIFICAAAAAGAWGLTLALPGSAVPGGVTVEDTPGPGSAVQVTAPPEGARTAGPAPDVVSSPPAGETPPDGDVEIVDFQPPESAAVGVAVGEDYDYGQSVPESGAVGEDYFADAVFIGDSRTDGFRLYSGLSQGDFLVKTGLSVFKIDKDQLKVEGRKMTVPQALERKRYGKVYVCLGLNELGMGNDQGYYDHYAALIDRIRAAQSEAVVYIQLLIPVNEEKCGEKGVSDYVNNRQIEVYNGLLRQLAQEKRVFLTDPAQAIVDPATGQPPYDAVADGVHFQKEPYRQWLDYLKRHTVRPEPEAGVEEEALPGAAPEAAQEEEPT